MRLFLSLILGGFGLSSLLITALLTTQRNAQSPVPWIVFASDGGSNTDLYRVRADGSRLTRLTQTATNEIQPTLSPNGRWLVFAGRDRNTLDLYRIQTNRLFSQAPIRDYALAERLTQSNVNRLEMNYLPDISPDNSQVVFIATYDSIAHVYTLRFADGQLQRISQNDQQKSFPHWAADGQSIYYTARTSDSGWLLYRVSLSDGSTNVISTESLLNSDAFIVAPHGETIAFRGQQGAQYALYRADILPSDGATPHKSEVAMITTIPMRPLATLDWSPDGAWLLYSIGYHQFWRVRTDGSENQLILEHDSPVSSGKWWPVADLPYQAVVLLGVGGLACLLSLFVVYRQHQEHITIS